MPKNLSIHLQNFPNVAFLNDEQELINDMDMVRQVCSAALFIRDQKNLRVRLPLKELTIIGKNANKMLLYKDIIAEEVNVKNIVTIEEIGSFAQLKLQINFKKLAARLPQKIKEITAAANQNNWQKIDDNKIAIVGEVLLSGEFEIKLITKNQENIAVLSSNDCLIELDIKVSQDLQEEGLARDIIRAIAQNRKEANLDISDRIKTAIFCPDSLIIQAINNYRNYIMEQTLSDQILVNQDQNNQELGHHFTNKIDDQDVVINIKVSA